jgi:hypothetical protein
MSAFIGDLARHIDSNGPTITLFCAIETSSEVCGLIWPTNFWNKSALPIL